LCIGYGLCNKYLGKLEAKFCFDFVIKTCVKFQTLSITHIFYFIIKCRRHGLYCSRGFQSTGEKATIFQSSVGTAHLNMTYMRRSYGTQLKFLDFHPWIEIHGYNIDRTYGTFKSLELVGNGQSFKLDASFYDEIKTKFGFQFT
jgi:hypothetical protein